jgi:hypothetical protein
MSDSASITLSQMASLLPPVSKTTESQSPRNDIPTNSQGPRGQTGCPPVCPGQGCRARSGHASVETKRRTPSPKSTLAKYPANASVAAKEVGKPLLQELFGRAILLAQESNLTNTTLLGLLRNGFKNDMTETFLRGRWPRRECGKSSPTRSFQPGLA